MTEVRYHEAAHEELLGELGYLELRKRGLGRRFLGEVRRAEALIAQFPLAGEEIVPGIRKRPLRKFRYSLFYALDENGNVLILAVAHQSRQPGYWIGRMHEG